MNVYLRTLFHSVFTWQPFDGKSLYIYIYIYKFTVGSLSLHCEFEFPWVSDTFSIGSN